MGFPLPSPPHPKVCPSVPAVSPGDSAMVRAHQARETKLGMSSQIPHLAAQGPQLGAWRETYPARKDGRQRGRAVRHVIPYGQRMGEEAAAMMYVDTRLLQS